MTATLRDGEQREGNVIKNAAGVPVATIRAGMRFPLKPVAQAQTEEVVKVIPLESAEHSKPTVLARVNRGGQHHIEIRECFIPTNEAGEPLPRAEWVTKTKREYKTMTVEGDEVCYSVKRTFSGSDESKSALQRAFAKI